MRDFMTRQSAGKVGPDTNAAGPNSVKDEYPVDVTATPATPTPASRRRRFLIAAAACLLVIATGVCVQFIWRSSSTAQTPASPPPAVPVTVANVSRQDVPIYLTGIGTVQAVLTVGIHSQVDGKLQEVLFQEGQRVHKGDVLAKIDPRLYQAALDQANAKKAQDVAQLAAFQKDLDRFQTLAKRGYDTQQNVDQQTAKVTTTNAQIAADDAAIETAQTQLEYTNIIAPNDGRIGLRMVDPGNVVHASDQGPIAVLVQTQPTTVLFTLPAQTLDQVRDAMAHGNVRVTVFDRDKRKALSEGMLQTVDNVIDQATASYRLKAIFTNKDERLWPGEFVNARAEIEVRRHALVVPNTAVQRGPSGLFVWLVGADSTAVMRPVETGPTVGDITIVTSGLDDGARVVVAGQYKLRNHAAVQMEAPPSTTGGAS
jgi:multidrug efflux system membrane fusion protein